MKKCFLSVMLAAAMTLSLAGCKKTASTPDTSASVSTETSVSVSAEVGEEPVTEPEKEVKETALISVEYGEENNRTVYVVKGEEKLGEYAIPEKPAYGSHFVYGDYVFYREYDKENEDGQGNDHIYKAYNYKTGEDKTFIRGTWKGSIDIYNGKVIVTTLNFYSNEYVEKYYDVETLEEVEGGSLILENLPEEYINGVWVYNQGNLRASSPERLMDECGSILIVNDGNYYDYDGKTVSDLGKIGETNVYPNVKYYNERTILYSAYDDYDYSSYRLIDEDIATGMTIVVSDNFGGVVGIEDGIVYYTEWDDTIFGLSGGVLYSYDLKKHEKTKLVSVDQKPGTNAQTVFSNVVINDGLVYARATDGKTRDWCILKDGEFKPLNLYPITHKVPEYGTVEYISKREKCPYCNATLGEFYGEYIIIDPKYTDKGDAIAKVLKEAVETRCESFMAEELYRSSSADKCEESAHGSVYSDVTYERRISDINILGDYVSVDMDAYWYGGGAHGMPYQFGYLFNLKTGEEVSFKDIYGGTEEDLKKIVAEKTKEDFLNEESDNYYDWDKDADSVYQHAYDYISFDNFPISYREDGVLLMYPPYEMASYAQGFVCVLISYEDLGITAFN